jgi:hypothetical protein
MSPIEKAEAVRKRFVEGTLPVGELVLHIEPILEESASDGPGHIEARRIVNAIERTIFAENEPKRSMGLSELLAEVVEFIRARTRITQHEAKAIALALAHQMAGRPVAIRDDLTVERSFGWVFAYDAVAAAGVSGERLYGDAPIIVDRDGRPSATGTSYETDDYVEAYEALGRERFDAGEWRQYLQAKHGHDV